MANVKITELNAAGSLAATDVVPVVDVSADETKKITATDLFRTLPDGTAAAPALAFSSDQANGVYLAGTDTVGISTGGTQRVTVDGSGNVSISGDLTVNGATTTVESTTVTIDDKNIELGSVATPTDTTADGGGITLKGATDKTLKWINSTGFWTFNQPLEVVGTTNGDQLRITQSGQHYRIGREGSGGLLEFYGAQSGYNGFIFGGANGERLRIDSSGNVGISNTTPSSYNAAADNLVVGATGDTGVTVASGSSNQGSLFFADGTSGSAAAEGYLIYVHSSNYMALGTANTERLRIDSSGRLGLGTSSPSYQFHVSNSSASGLGVFTRTSGASTYIEGAASSGTVGTVGSHPLNFTTNSTTAITIDTSQKVGIGTTSPSSLASIKKDISSATAITAANSQVGIFSGSGTGTQHRSTLYFSPINSSGNGSPAAISTIASGNTNSSLAFYTNGANNYTGTPVERLRIDSAGNVGVNTSNPQAELHLNDATGLSRIRLSGGANLADNFEFGQGTTGVTNGGFEIRDVDASATRFVINSSGNVGIGTTSPSSKLNLSGGAENVLLETSNSSGDAFFGIRNGSYGLLGTGDAYIYRSGGDIALLADGASDVIKFATGGNSERLRIDSSGRVLIGTTSARTKFFNNSSLYSGKLQVEGISESTRISSLVHNTNNAAFPIFVLGKSRGTSVGSHTVVQNGDGLGSLSFQGADGSELVEAASIKSEVDGTPGSNDMPGRLVFSTTADGASSTTERMRIDSSGDVTITSTGSLTIPVGTTAQRPSSPAQGMIRRNTTDSAFEGYTGNAWAPLGGGATGGGSDAWVVETDQTVTTSYELGSGKHGTTVSPTINSGATITVPSGAILVIL